MRIHDLRDRHKGKDLYIVGTGPSLRFVPISFFKNKITLGLNQAWKYFQAGQGPTYSVTVHPEHVREWEQAGSQPETLWVARRRDPYKLELGHPRHFVFLSDDSGQDRTVGKTGRSLFITRPRKDQLYRGGGVHATAMHLAALMGAANIVLVGVDMGSLEGEHHGHEQHTQFRGMEPEQVYGIYRKHAALVRGLLHEHYGVNILTLSPFLGLYHAAEDRDRLVRARELAPLPVPEDISRKRGSDKGLSDLPQPLLAMIQTARRQLYEKPEARVVLMGADLNPAVAAPFWKVLHRCGKSELVVWALPEIQDKVRRRLVGRKPERSGRTLVLPPWDAEPGHLLLRRPLDVIYLASKSPVRLSQELLDPANPPMVFAHCLPLGCNTTVAEEWRVGKKAILRLELLMDGG